MEFVGFFINVFIIAILCFVPVVLWGYFFSFVDNSRTNTKRFVFGLIAGMVSTIPILWLDRVYEIPVLGILNIFQNITELSALPDYVRVFFSYAFLVTIISAILTIFSAIIGKILRPDLNLLAKSILGSLGVSITLVVSFFILDVFSELIPLFNGIATIDPLSFGSAIFNSLKLVIFYYLTIAFLEELAKHFSFIGSIANEQFTIKKGILYSIFIALGFSFLENILYGIRIVEEFGFGTELGAIILYRSIFSLLIHVFASSILGYFFAKAYLSYKDKGSIWLYLKQLIIGMSVAIFIHASFDVLVTYGINFMIFSYFIIAYFLVSKLLYINEKN